MLVDANVFKGFFQAQIGKAHTLQGCPNALLSLVSVTTPLYHDDNKIIEHEWQNVVDPEWFQAWLSANLIAGHIVYMAPFKNVGVEKQIQSKGFPKGRDVIYIRVALAVAQKHLCNFYTEDIDFYDPTQKGCKASTRIKMLKASSGPIPKILTKNNVAIQCVP